MRSSSGVTKCVLGRQNPSAIRFVRKMRGGTQAHLLQADDGRYYVVKFKNNPQQIRSLVNEWIVSGVMKHLGIRTPAVKAIQITEEFLSKNPNVYLQYGERNVPVAPGLHFGSQYPGDPDRTSVQDFMPQPLLRTKTENLDDFIGALVVDKWTGNTDKRQAVFTWSKASGYSAHMIDHGSAFDGWHWIFADAPLMGLYRDLAAYCTVAGWDQLEPWLERVAEFPREIIWQRVAEIPREWIDHEGDEINRLIEKLLIRRKRVARLIESLLETEVTVFPNWHSTSAAA